MHMIDQKTPRSPANTNGHALITMTCDAIDVGIQFHTTSAMLGAFSEGLERLSRATGHSKDSLYAAGVSYHAI